MKKAKSSPKVGKGKKSPKVKGAVPMEELKRFDFSIPHLDKTDENTWKRRVFMFTPATGLVRMEWVQARYSQIIPTNWSNVEVVQFLSPYVPIGYQLADAQNLMAKHVVEGDYDWVIYIEHDNILPPDGFMRFNQYMNEQNIPVVSGLYWLKSDITEPLLYRGRGTSHFRDWKLGDKVWVDGIPFGFRLEHASLIRAAWEESEEYTVNGVVTRRVFGQPNSMWFDEEKGGMVATGGTTDLAWCTRLMKDGLFEKAGWSKYQKMENPFLVDTNIFVKHISPNGEVWPKAIPARYIPPKGYKGKTIR